MRYYHFWYQPSTVGQLEPILPHTSISAARGEPVVG